MCVRKKKKTFWTLFFSLYPTTHTHSRRERERARVVFRRLWFRTVDFCVVTHSLTLRVKWFFSFKKRENIKKRRRGRKQVWASNWEFRVGRRDTYRALYWCESILKIILIYFKRDRVVAHPFLIIIITDSRGRLWLVRVLRQTIII